MCDESMITRESMPGHKTVDCNVVSDAINQVGGLHPVPGQLCHDHYHHHHHHQEKEKKKGLKLKPVPMGQS